MIGIIKNNLPILTFIILVHINFQFIDSQHNFLSEVLTFINNSNQMSFFNIINNINLYTQEENYTIISILIIYQINYYHLYFTNLSTNFLIFLSIISVHLNN